ncbi:cytochrome ubiquinol oxidase subunit I [Pantoea tagorei]
MKCWWPFFLESGLTGVMLFGMGKIKPGLHFIVTCFVTLGALLSAFWILAANSWLQTPTGFTRDDSGRFLPESWAMVLSAPSFPFRFSHMLLASLIAVAFMVAGVAARRLLLNVQEQAARRMLTAALSFTLVAVPLQVAVGDLHGENTLAHQPAKLAAIEGSWHPPAANRGEPLRLFAWPDQQAQRNRLELAIPDIASLYLRHNLTGHIKSLSEFDAQSLPPVAPVFFRLSPDGGAGDGHAYRQPGGERAALARTPDHVASPAAYAGMAFAGGLYRYAGRLAGDGNRPSALDGLRYAAHRRQYLRAVALHHRGDPGRYCCGLRPELCAGPALSAAAGLHAAAA